METATGAPLATAWASDAVYGGRSTPRSVTIAVTNRAGVTGAGKVIREQQTFPCRH